MSDVLGVELITEHWEMKRFAQEHGRAPGAGTEFMVSMISSQQLNH